MRRRQNNYKGASADGRRRNNYTAWARVGQNLEKNEKTSQCRKLSHAAETTLFHIVINSTELYTILIHLSELYPILIHSAELYPLLKHRNQSNSNRQTEHPSRQPEGPSRLLRHPRALGAWKTLLGSRFESARYSLF